MYRENNGDDILEPMMIEDLATMVVKGFEELKQDIRDEFLPRFSTLESKIDAVRSEMNDLLYEGNHMRKRIEKLEERAFGAIQRP